jgi:hypothetical protein
MTPEKLRYVILVDASGGPVTTATCRGDRTERVEFAGIDDPRSVRPTCFGREVRTGAG